MRFKHSLLGHLLAFVAGFFSIVAVSAVWIGYLQVGRPLDAWTGGVTIIFVPLLLLIFSVLWLIVRLVLQRFLILSLLTITWTSALASYLVITVMCGPTTCFIPSSSERGLGFFLVGGAVLFALVHHLVLTRFLKPTAQPKLQTEQSQTPQ